MEETCAREALAGTGVQASRPVHSNQTAPALVAEALRRNEGRLSADGAFMVETGVHTGRSVQDKFVVDEPSVTADIWWGKINQRMPVDRFNALKGRVQAYLQGQELFTQDLYAGADPDYRVRVRLVTTQAWNALFARNMFIRPPERELDELRARLRYSACSDVPDRPGGGRRAVLDHHRPVVRAEADRHRRHRVCRRGQEVDLHRDELAAARARA